MNEKRKNKLQILLKRLNEGGTCSTREEMSRLQHPVCEARHKCLTDPASREERAAGIQGLFRRYNVQSNRIRYTILKIYYDQIKRNITTQFLTQHLLTLLVYKCSILLRLVMRQTSKRYSNSSHSLPKKVICARAMALTILSQSS
jgi:hypothetical protein